MKKYIGRTLYVVFFISSTIANAQSTNNGYTLKDGKVYFLNEEIEQADQDSFKVLGHGYAKDRNNVYYKGDVLLYVEPATFKLKGTKDNTTGTNPNRGYYKIGNDVFYNGKKIKGVFTVRDFKDLGDGYAIDTFDVYYEGVKIQGVHAFGFKNLGKGYAKDSFNTYYLGKKME